MIGVIDAKSGNLTSLEQTLRKSGLEVKRIKEPDFSGLDALVLPGQGRFGFVMGQLEAHGFLEPIQNWIRSGRKFVGICVGMQVLFSRSEEDPESTGLGIFPEDVLRLDGPKHPMMGWIPVHWNRSEEKRSLTRPFRDGSAYFVNSFAVRQSPYNLAQIDYGSGFVAAIGRENLFAFQFHPEKSGTWGRELLLRCLS